MGDGVAGPDDGGRIYKVALASIVGSVIEQYDFLVTGVIAATVWGDVYFKLPALAAIAAAIGVYGIGILIRPIGAYIFGHLADRYGRKDALVYALVLMGVSTLLIGLTPSYDMIGIAAPALLILFRLAQGISFGAEFGTASTWVIEQAARSRHRAFWSAWVGFAIPIGLLLGFGSVIVLKLLIAPEGFLSWGWRILFLFGFLVAIVGIVIRTRTEDSFLFERHRAQSAVLDYPATQVWRDMPLTILRTSLVNAMFGGAFFLYFVFGTSYMKAVGFKGTTPELIGLIAAAFMLVFMIIGSLLADLINRRTILLIAAVVFLVFAIPYFDLVNTGSFLRATVGEIIGFGFVFGFGYGALPAFYTENFPTRYRASGASAGYQISQVYGGGLIPILAGLILNAYGIHRAYLYIGLLVMVYAVLAILAILATPETKKIDLEGMMQQT
ncbi:MFS transporter [Bradyrhizobium sp. ISRA443]|uniref:MFS transporter n=1 Tax=unclassified Bradyrhizobium TaxID=2631580 RepID=UPI00247A7ABF|nr:MULTISPECIES: MFS transporter [unclassified Bradyrhizobium]WGR94940.1 MFS transporter [Bradyrhizobium sp. ISRA435]WGR99800.1 MFS transporter [Bradyrhizobium sp. ISRA436]WGS06690.1 MFS transporter [Bradyrhizobium sp. ISRA437]WGS13574.1 MFS transporter [Bradyrhizobium sp. ISRA443]